MKENLFLKDKISNIPTSIILVFIFLLGICLYSGALSNDFVWDDEVLIIGNSQLHNNNNIFNFFLGPIHKEFPGHYRPLQMVSYKIDFSVWGLDPFGYHLTSILLHIFNGILVYVLAQFLFKNKLVSSFCGFIFLIHPALSECVNYISSRSNLIVLAFLLLSLISYLKNELSKNKIFFAISICLFIFSLFSNEISMAFPLFLILYELINKKKIKNSWLYLLILLFFIILRARIIPLDTHIDQLSGTPAFLTTLKIIFNYFKIMLLPVNLHKLWQVATIKKVFSLEFFIYALFVFSIIAMCKYLYRKNRASLVWVLWFILMILPVSQAKSLFYKLPNISEGWLYVPAIGLIYFIAYFLYKWIKSANRAMRVVFIFFMCFLFFIYGAFTIKQNKIWNNPVNLFNNILNYSGNYPPPDILYALGINYYKTGNYIQALDTFENAILEFKKFGENKKELFEIYNMMGNIYLELKLYKNAAEVLDKAIVISPSNSNNYYKLAVVYLMQNNTAKAVRECKKAIEIENKTQYIDLLKIIRVVENNIKANKQFNINIQTQFK